jgi:hypothetical protein
MLNDKLQTNFEQLRSILEPIVFCDLFEYPLTAYEIWKYTKKQLALEAVFILLQQLVVRGDIVSENNGFYFLKGREYILEMRQKRYNYSCAKLKIASRFSRLFALVPFVKTVAVANFIGDHNVREVGLHYSYGSFLNNDALRKEIVELKKVIIESGGVWKKIGGRAHYLRWKYPDSLEQYGDTDLYYDSTLAYAEIPGFRAGTSREYLGFNIKNKTKFTS